MCRLFSRGGPVMWPIYFVLCSAPGDRFGKAVFPFAKQKRSFWLPEKIGLGHGPGRGVEASSLIDEADTPVEKVIAAGFAEFFNHNWRNWRFDVDNPSEQEVLDSVEEAMESRAAGSESDAAALPHFKCDHNHRSHAGITGDCNRYYQ